MPEYDLCILCSECGSFHDLSLRVSFDRFFEVCLVRDLYGEEFPPEFYEVLFTSDCPVTGTQMKQHDPGEMLLVLAKNEFLDH